MDTNFTGEEIFAGAEKSYTEMTAGIKKWFRSNYWILYAILCFSVPILSSILQPSFKNPFTAEAISETLLNVMISMSMIIVMLPRGRQSGIGDGSTMQDSRKVLAEASAKVRDNGLTRKFHEYCRVVEKDRMIEEKRRYVSFAAIEWSEYVDKYQNATIKKMRAEGLSKRQIRYIVMAQNYNHIIPIHADFILTGISKSSYEKVGTQSGQQRQKKALIVRAMSMIAVVIAFSSIAYPYFFEDNVSTISVISVILTKTISIMWAAFSGYRMGKEQAEWEITNNYQCKTFLDTFLASQNSDDTFDDTFDDQKGVKRV